LLHAAPGWILGGVIGLLGLIAVGVILGVALYRLGDSVGATNANGDHDAWRDSEHHWTHHGPSQTSVGPPGDI
jgi:hypothetical protein